MCKWLLSVAAAATLLLASGGVVLAADAGKGTIKGTLTNLTAGGESVSGKEVTLTAYSGDSEIGQKTARADKDGKFVFDGLDTGDKFVYQLSVEHQGAPYYSEPITFTADATEQSVELQLFDTTTDESVVKSAARHYLIEPGQDSVSVSEIVILSNSSDRAYVGSKEIHPGAKETVRFALPPGAQNVQYGSGLLASRVIPIEGGFADTMPVYPGDSERVFRYSIPVKDGAATFVSKITSATDKVNVLIPDTGVQISVSNLPNRSSSNIQGEKFLLLSGQNLAAGTELEFKLDRLPRAQAGTPTWAVMLAGGSVVLVLMLAAAAVLRRRRAKQRMAPSLAEEADTGWPHNSLTGDDLEKERKRLVAEIAQLDEQYEEGAIGSEEYGRLRADKKRRLIEIVGMQQSSASTKAQP